MAPAGGPFWRDEGSQRRTRRVAAVTVAAIMLISAMLAGCAGPGGTSSQPPRPESPAASAGEMPSSTPRPVTLRFALDWTPNTNHLGLFVARASGWYDEQAVDLELLPYSGATPEALMAAGQADCGLSFQDALTFAAAAGAPIVSVMAILQHAASGIAVLAGGPLERPRGEGSMVERVKRAARELKSVGTTLYKA